MENYILFSTCEPYATNNVSLYVKTELSPREFNKEVIKVCRYDNFTVSPIGMPVGDPEVYGLEGALKIISQIVLYRTEMRVSNKFIEEIELPKECHVEPFDGFTDRVIVSINSSFSEANNELLLEEHSIVSKLIDMFPNIGYYKTRSKFVILPYNKINERKGTEEHCYYGIIAGKLIEYREILSPMNVKL